MNPYIRPLNPSVLALLGVSALFTLSSMEAGPLIAGGDVTLQGTAQISLVDRVSPNATSPSDTIYAFIPSINYLRESTVGGKLSANLSLPIRRYDESDSLDSNSIDFDMSGEIPFGAGPKLSGNWGVSYFDGIQANYLTNQNLDSEALSFNAFADYALRPLLSLRARASYSDRSSDGVDTTFINANTTTRYSLGLHARQLIRGRVGVYAEYQIQDRKTDRSLTAISVDDREDGLNFGITGQILPERLFPKLEADLSFGFSSTSGSDRFSSGTNAGRRNRLTLDGRLAYPANPKTNVALTFRRNLAVSDADQTVEQTDLNFSVDYTPRPKLAFVTSVGIQSNDFIYDLQSRSDDVLTGSVRASYQLRPNWSTDLSYNYRNSDSTRAFSDYSSSQYTLSTTILY